MSKQLRHLDEHRPAVKIIRKWQSNYAFAAAIGKTPSTTDRWLVSGSIPESEFGNIVKCGRAEGIKLSPEDFLDMRIFA